MGSEWASWWEQRLLTDWPRDGPAGGLCGSPKDQEKASGKEGRQRGEAI